MMDLPTPHARWLHHWLLLIQAANLTLAATLAALLALGGRSTELKIVIVLASASVIGFVGLALPVAWVATLGLGVGIARYEARGAPPEG